jgi:hypothetical protein
MKSLFVSMIFYGTLVGQIGGAVLLVGILMLVVYGCGQMDERDEEFNADPASAIKPPSTLTKLDSEDCESSASKF